MTVVTEADLTREGPTIVHLLQQYVNRQAGERRFDWLYLQGPHGAARTWIARDCEQIVGMGAAFPRRVYTAGCPALAWVLGDFCIAPKYRSMGTALQLQRACLAGICEGAGWYDFPSDRMVAVYRRLGIESHHRMVRLAKRLRVEDKLTTFLGNRTLGKMVSAPANLLLQTTARRRHVRGLDVSLHGGPFGPEFSALADAVGARYGTCVQRSSQFLNWRYCAHPQLHYEVLAARQDGSLLAYAVFTCTDRELRIVDLFGWVEPETIAGLLTTIIELALTRRVQVINAHFLPPQPLVSLMRSLGFWIRESAPVMIRDPGSMTGGRCWFLSEGDRES